MRIQWQVVMCGHKVRSNDVQQGAVVCRLHVRKSIHPPEHEGLHAGGNIVSCECFT